MMDRLKARPLQPLALPSRPLTPHALSWSCDAELAIATAESIHIFLPEYASTLNGTDLTGTDPASSPHQFSLSLQPSAIVPPTRPINARLCAQSDTALPQDAGSSRGFRGVGPSAIGGSGSALGQVVRLEWSPTGLGCNLRPVLAGLTTSGSVVVFGERIGSEGAAGMRARGFKNWKMLWALGAGFCVPDGDCERGIYVMSERVTGFSWAREVEGLAGRAFCAYGNDEGEVGVMSVQYGPKEGGGGGGRDEFVWSLKELGRFNASGPHQALDVADPGFAPGGSTTALRWSPWLVCDGYRTATIAYLARNYVGFRRVTVYGAWERGETPNIVVEESDTTGVCLFLSSDACIEWEDAVWPEGDAFCARGVIATPFAIKPFQIALNGIPNPPLQPHHPRTCSSLYPPSHDSTNPITGLVVHPPDLHRKPDTPFYTAVRLSATATNTDWYQTNLPDSVPLPQWAEDIAEQTARLVSRGTALAGIPASDSDSDSEPDSDADPGADVNAGDPATQVHPLRFRIWGLALSPGGSSSALFFSKHSAQHPDRRAASSIVFDCRTGSSSTATATATAQARTTEGKMWEWLYGAGEPLSRESDARPSPLRERFRRVARSMRCVFCGAGFKITGDEATCQNGHPFTTCAASGVPIMAPGVSRVCGVCNSRCLKLSELERLAGDISAEGVVAASGEVCGSCGGKFVV